MTPLPDDTVIVPVAMVKYRLRRIAVPLFAGKVVHNLVIAVVFYYGTGIDVPAQARTYLALLIIVAFVLVVLYQVERARLTSRRPQSPTEPAR